MDVDLNWLWPLTLAVLDRSATIFVTLATSGWPLAVILTAYIFRKEIALLVPDVEQVELPLGMGSFKRKQVVQLERKSAETEALVAVGTAIYRSTTVAAIEATIQNEIIKHPADERTERLINELAQTRLARGFEIIYANIFKTQVSALRELKARGGAVTLQEAVAYFESTRAGVIEYEGKNSFDRWLTFLKEWDLVGVDGDRAMLRPIADDFLLFLKQKPEVDNLF